MSKYTILERRRDREANMRFLRMFAVSMLAHVLVLSTAALAYRKPDSSLREKAIKVSLHAPGLGRAQKPKANISRPALAAKSITKAQKSSAKAAKPEKSPQKKIISTSKSAVTNSKEPEKSPAAVTENDQRLRQRRSIITHGCIPLPSRNSGLWAAK